MLLVVVFLKVLYVRFVDLANVIHGVLSFVGEVLRCRNDCYY